MTATFNRLSDLLSAMRARAAATPAAADPRLRAATLAMAHFGADFTMGQPAAVNVAALAFAMPRLRVHELRAPVPEIVAETDLHALPGEPPALLRGGAVLLEVGDLEHETLVGALPFADGGWQRTVCLGAYLLEGTWYLVGLGHPDGIIVSRWRPRWGEADVSAGVVARAEGDLLVGDVEGYDDWGRDAARALVVLGLLLDAVESPLRVADEGPRLAGRTKSGESRPARAWSVSRIYLAPRPRPEVHEGGGEGKAREGRELEPVRVRGFLRRQPHGPGGRERRWIYVAEHAARRWVAPRPARVVVGWAPRKGRR